jgi:hypothetical protein
MGTPNGAVVVVGGAVVVVDWVPVSSALVDDSGSMVVLGVVVVDRREGVGTYVCDSLGCVSSSGLTATGP